MSWQLFNTMLTRCSCSELPKPHWGELNSSCISWVWDPQCFCSHPLTCLFCQRTHKKRRNNTHMTSLSTSVGPWTTKLAKNIISATWLSQVNGRWMTPANSCHWVTWEQDRHRLTWNGKALKSATVHHHFVNQQWFSDFGDGKKESTCIQLKMQRSNTPVHVYFWINNKTKIIR